MAKQRPTLGTFAQPVSTFVQPIDPEKTVAPVDQQAVRESYAFAEMFGQLSESAARLASTIKMDMNKDAAAAGALLVNQSRQSYAELERAGKIKPNENPWFAVGAQQASGILEAHKSAVEIESLYEQHKKENPAFLDDTKAFDALVSSYVANKSAGFGSAQYLSGAFFDNFNPTVVRLQQKNLDDIENSRFSKYINASRAKTDLAISDMSPLTYGDSIADIQNAYDEFVRNSPGRAGEIGQAFAAQLVDLMRSSDRHAEAELILNSLKSGTGPLANTEFVKSLLIKYGPEIEKNRQTSVSPEARKIVEKAQEISDTFDNGGYGAGMDSVKRATREMERFADELSAGIDDAPQVDSYGSKYLQSKKNSIDDARRGALDALSKRFDAYLKDEVAAAKSFREELAAQTQNDLRSQISAGNTTPSAAYDKFLAVITNPQYGYSEKEQLELRKQFENDSEKMWKDYEDGRSAAMLASSERRVSEEIGGSLLDFAVELAVNPGQTTITPLPPTNIRPKIDSFLREANLNEEQRKKSKDRMYASVVAQTSDRINALLTKSKASGGMAPFDVESLEPAPSDTSQVLEWKTQARYVRNHAMMEIDSLFEQENTIARFRDIAATQLNIRTQEMGLTPDVEDLYRVWSGVKSGFAATKLFNTPEGKRISEIFQSVQTKMVAVRKTSLQDAFVDALSAYTSSRGSNVEKWTEITSAQSGEKKDYEGKVGRLIDKFEVVNPDAIRLLEGMFAFELVSAFGSTNKFNLAASMNTAMKSVEENLIPIRGSFLPKIGGIGEGQFTTEHFNNLADFYAGADKEAVFLPIDIDSTGNYIFALRDKNGNTLQARLFTMDDLVSEEAYKRSTFHRLQRSKKDDGSEREYMKQKDLEFIDYSFTDEARIARQTRLFNLREQAKKAATKGATQ